MNIRSPHKRNQEMQLSDKALGFDNLIIFTCIEQLLQGQTFDSQIQIISFYLEPPVTFFFSVLTRGLP